VNAPELPVRAVSNANSALARLNASEEAAAMLVKYISHIPHTADDAWSAAAEWKAYMEGMR